ncbi:phage tail protein [Janibacter melonis]|uniref:Phage tail protein n=1 Tax=Janibacter melonis TaxID=262209 RepID=A0A5P8FJH5_9MICO|nr:phage tail protein [Janibacter melonis]QFQ29709.1 phage tail protein [Janibacter melonis]
MAKADILAGAPLTGTGGVLVAPTGTTPLPTDSSTALPPAFKATGYVGEDGVTMSTERSVETIKAWGGDTVRTLQTEHDVTFSWSFLETNADVLKEVYGAANVTTTAASSTKGTLQAIQVKGDALPERAYVFEMRDGAARLRIVVPNLQITETSDATFVHSDVVRYEVTAQAMPDANGVKAYIFTDNGVTTA